MTTRDETLLAVLPDYRSWLYRVANDMCASHPGDVDDVAQEGYIAMWRAIDKWDPAKGALPTWLTGAAKLRMREFTGRGTPFGKPPARGSRDVEPSAHIEGFLDADDIFPAVDALEDVEIAYHSGEIAAAIDRLTPEQRRYVIARFWLGIEPSSRVPAVMEACKLIPELAPNKRWLWHGRNGARVRLAEDLAHLDPTLERTPA